MLKDIREELKELRLLCKGLVEKLVPIEKPTEEEREKLSKKKDEIADEKELMKALGKTNV